MHGAGWLVASTRCAVICMRAAALWQCWGISCMCTLGSLATQAGVAARTRCWAGARHHAITRAAHLLHGWAIAMGRWQAAIFVTCESPSRCARQVLHLRLQTHHTCASGRMALTAVTPGAGMQCLPQPPLPTVGMQPSPAPTATRWALTQPTREAQQAALLVDEGSRQPHAAAGTSPARACPLCGASCSMRLLRWRYDR